MNLTPRELEVLRLMCLSYAEIMKRLSISHSTVRSHIHNILNKFYTSSRAKALIYALKEGIINVEEIIID